MSPRDPNSPDTSPREEASEMVAVRKSQLPDKKTVPQNTGWIRGERRHPDNAKIRRWMDLGDKALQNTDEEDPTAK